MRRSSSLKSPGSLGPNDDDDAGDSDDVGHLPRKPDQCRPSAQCKRAMTESQRKFCNESALKQGGPVQRYCCQKCRALGFL